MEGSFRKILSSVCMLFQQAFLIKPDDAAAHTNLRAALAQEIMVAEAIARTQALSRQGQKAKRLPKGGFLRSVGDPQRTKTPANLDVQLRANPETQIGEIATVFEGIPYLNFWKIPDRVGPGKPAL